ncbi:hypothetical protein [Rufibacter roseus]|uniref:Uncharacterized protein n=1 Tax=Rufibacter roseus TaxID=1567108 RepID=A0ABW2DI19_9BACT|nr:hypothetical protein [Rufibacter roseus]
MAEINIEPKKRSSGWSWIIVLLILAVVGWLLYRYLLEPQTNSPETTDVPATGWVMPVSPNYYTT